MEQENCSPKAGCRLSAEVLRLRWEEKRRICEEWEASGLSKAAFCGQKQLSLSTFQGWVRRQRGKIGRDFCPIKIIGAPTYGEDAAPMLLEVLLPNGVIGRVEATPSQFGFLLKELFHAAAIVR